MGVRLCLIWGIIGFLSLHEVLGVGANHTIVLDIIHMRVNSQGLERVVGHLGGESEQCGRISLGDLTTYSGKV